MRKRERLEHTLAGEAVDRPPVFVMRHWPGDDLRAADLAHACQLFQQTYDWDLAVIAPASNFSVTGYGLDDRWSGALNGQREVTRPIIERSLDWTELRPLDPTRGDLGRHLECTRLLDEVWAADGLPYLHVLYSPLDQAVRLGGRERVLRSLRTHPDRFRTGMNALTETTLRFIEALRRTSLAGICYVAEYADYAFLSEQEYNAFALPFDRKILESLPERWWLNILQMPSTSPMLHILSTYPVQALQWRNHESGTTLAEARSFFRGVLACGLSAELHLHEGTPAMIRDAARSAMVEGERRRFVLSAGSPLLVTTPLSNLRTLRASVESARSEVG